jgi:DNA-binding GntR family transcriptional regulator
MSHRPTIADRILKSLREEIINCTVNAGEMLSEMEISRRYGSSKTPAREALNSLCVEGFLEKLPNRGYLVRAVSLGDIQNLFQYRYILESASAELAAMKVTTQGLAELKQMLVSADGISEAEIGERYNELNRAFHMQLAHMSGNPYLVQAVGNVLDQLRRALTMDLHTTKPQSALLEHVDLVEAIEKRDAERARQLMQEHLNISQSRIFNQHIYNR